MLVTFQFEEYNFQEKKMLWSIFFCGSLFVLHNLEVVYDILKKIYIYIYFLELTSFYIKTIVFGYFKKLGIYKLCVTLFSRLGKKGAALQSPLWLIIWFISGVTPFFLAFPGQASSSNERWLRHSLNILSVTALGPSKSYRI